MHILAGIQFVKMNLRGDRELFSYIEGKVVYRDSDLLVIENNGIGYNIYTSARTMSDVDSLGSMVKIYTYMNVKEDGISLYGFSKKEELNLFKMLLMVSGVGPKVARSILSTLTPAKFILAVITKDEKALIASPGVGKKAAQRIILELQDKIKKEELSMKNDEEDSIIINDKGGDVKEAINALIVLGYDYNSAQSKVSNVYKEGMAVEEIVKFALKSSLG